MEDVMNVAFLVLGGNLGDRTLHISESCKNIEQECGTIVLASKLYETEAWGISSSNKFLNQVIQLNTMLTAEVLLIKLLDIEKKHGRTRSNETYADRTIDIDILFFNSEIIEEANIQVPHPRLHMRKFVLIPLNEIAQNFIHPTLHKSIGELLKDCTDTLEVRLLKS